MKSLFLAALFLVSSLAFSQGTYPRNVSIGASQTLTNAERNRVVLADCTGNDTYTLPVATTQGVVGDASSSNFFEIKRSNSAAGDCTLDGNGSDTIDGALTYVLSSQYAWVRVQSVGTTDWKITASSTALAAPLEASAPRTLTEKALDCEASGNVCGTVALVEWIAGVNQAGAATGGCSTPSLTAPLPTAIAGSATVPTLATLAFDAATDEYIQCRFWAPHDWTGVIDFDTYWRAASTTGEAEWCVAVISVADGETIGPTFNAGHCVNDTAKGTTLQANLATRTSILLTGVAANELVFVKFFRNADASDEDSTITDDDDMTGDAEAISFRLKMRRAQ